MSRKRKYYEMAVKLLSTGLTAGLLLSACGETENVRYSTVMAFGEPYQVRTRTVTQGDRTYETSSVKVGAYWFPCIVDSPGDCEKAAQTNYDSFDPR